MIDATVLHLWQEVSQTPGTLPPANLYVQAVQLIVTTILTVAVPMAARWLKSYVAEREARVAAEQKRIAEDLATKASREAEEIAKKVAAEIERARKAADFRADTIEATVRHQVREELARYREEIMQSQRLVIGKIDDNTARTEQARSEANNSNAKIAELREAFNSLLGATADERRHARQAAETDRESDKDTNRRVKRVEEHTAGGDDGGT